MIRRPPRDGGWVEVIVGPMFSGKSEELIRRLRRAEIAGQTVYAYKPGIDTRSSGVATRTGIEIVAEQLEWPPEMLKCEADVIGIDEAQFLPDSVINTVNQLREAGRRVVISGLDMDFRGKPFGPVPQLMAIADFVDKLQAVCVKCGDPACISYRVVDIEDTIVVGSDEYEARCRRCAK